MDWLEDMLYWTNINENKIRRLNLTSTDVLATSPEKIQVEGTSINGSKFRGIVLNPRIRYEGILQIHVAIHVVDLFALPCLCTLWERS